jgi:hypothetical protein
MVRVMPGVAELKKGIDDMRRLKVEGGDTTGESLDDRPSRLKRWTRVRPRM